MAAVKTASTMLKDLGYDTFDKKPNVFIKQQCGISIWVISITESGVITKTDMLTGQHLAFSDDEILAIAKYIEETRSSGTPPTHQIK